MTIMRNDGELVMKDIAVIVCNFNKRNYVLDCIDSILQQAVNNFDVFVVDNASTDGSAAAIKGKFADSVRLIENPINTGGSGGFNAGMQAALKGNYRYLVLVDNDIKMDRFAIDHLYRYMESHSDAAMAGALVFKMDQPDTIMAFGSELDPVKYEYRDCYRDCIDEKLLPEVNECDYVPACTVMVRRNVVDTIGLMDERNFLYWDDIDWATRMKRAGYKVVAVKSSKVWHKGGGVMPNNTAPVYYFIRNNIKFYTTYLPDDELETYAKAIMKNIYLRLNGCYLKGKNNYSATVVRAYEDGLHGVSGKASADCILPEVEEHNKFNETIEKCNKCLIWIDGNNKDEKSGFGVVTWFINLLSVKWPEKQFYISCGKCTDKYEEIKSSLILPVNVSLSKTDPENEYDVKINLLNDIRSLSTYKDGEIYVDNRCNLISNHDDFMHFYTFPQQLDRFITFNKKYFLDCFKELRKEQMTD